MTLDEAETLLPNVFGARCMAGCLVIDNNHRTWDQWVELAERIILADLEHNPERNTP